MLLFWSFKTSFRALVREREREINCTIHPSITLVCDSLEQRRRGERDGTTAATVAPGHNAPSVSDR